MGRKSFGDRGDHADRNRILKKQIEKLKVENARLRKELNKLLSYVRKPEDMEGDAQEERQPEIVRCPECGSPNTAVVDLSHPGVKKLYFVCKEKNCGYRKKI